MTPKYARVCQRRNQKFVSFFWGGYNFWGEEYNFNTHVQ